MIFSLFRKDPATDEVLALYAATVAQARQPIFYTQWGVPDTVTGRFDMLCLHLALLFRRFRAEGAATRDFAQALFDVFMRDMDGSLRELGAADLGIAKRVRKMNELFYGLLAALDDALNRSDRAALEAVLMRNVFDNSASPDVAALAGYTMAQGEALAAQSSEALLAGKVVFGEAG